MDFWVVCDDGHRLRPRVAKPKAGLALHFWDGKGFDAGPPQVEAVSLSFCTFLSSFRVSLGSRPAFLPSRPYFRVCVLVAVFLSTETSLYT